MLLELRPGDGGTDSEATPLLLDLPHLGDLLYVDQQRRRDDLGPHLYKQIGATGQDARFAAFLGQELDGSIDRIGRLISHRVIASRVGSLSEVLGGPKELHTARAEPTPQRGLRLPFEPPLPFG